MAKDFKIVCHVKFRDKEVSMPLNIIIVPLGKKLGGVPGFSRSYVGRYDVMKDQYCMGMNGHEIYVENTGLFLV